MRAAILVIALILTAAAPAIAAHPTAHLWSEAEKATLLSLTLDALPPLPDDPSNRFDTDPRAATLGRRLFEDTRLSRNGKVACATCHIPDQSFTDHLPVSHGIADTRRRSMPLAGAAYSPWLFWDGRADSLWAQALGPIESPEEHGISRTRCAMLIKNHYQRAYEEIFGPLPDLPYADLESMARPAADDATIQVAWISMPLASREAITVIYANIGKAIAAFVRTIVHTPAPFDHYALAAATGDTPAMERLLATEAALGLKLFIGPAGCINCHNGPLFSNNDFHKVGIPDVTGLPKDMGRAEGILKVLTSEFNCTGRHSDAGPADCAELRFIDPDVTKYLGAFKTPSLRNVADRPPYMHAGQFMTLREVLVFYQKNALRESGGRPDITHGRISDAEVGYLEAFLRTLSSPIAFGVQP
ncbi:MAG: cytochrome c peroxidase [Thermodesulfobacteriota bacterium]